MADWADKWAHRLAFGFPNPYRRRDIAETLTKLKSEIAQSLREARAEGMEAERDACAKACDDQATYYLSEERKLGAADCAFRIRRRAHVEGTNAGWAYGLTNCCVCNELTNDYWFDKAGKPHCGKHLPAVSGEGSAR